MKRNFISWYIKLVSKINSVIIGILLSLVYGIIIIPYSLFVDKKQEFWHDRQHVYNENDTKFMW